jgi:hypothetical protein
VDGSILQRVFSYILPRTVQGVNIAANEKIPHGGIPNYNIKLAGLKASLSILSATQLTPV